MISKNKESDFYREVLKLKYETMPVYILSLSVSSPYIVLTRTYPWEPVRNVLGVGGVQYALLTPENFEMKVTSYAWQNNKRIMGGKPRKNTVSIVSLGSLNLSESTKKPSMRIDGTIVIKSVPIYLKLQTLLINLYKLHLKKKSILLSPVMKWIITKEKDANK